MPVREIVAQKILADIRAGMSRTRILEKYGLSRSTLEELVGVLVDVNAITREELFGDLYFQCDELTEVDRRSFQRHHVSFELPVYDVLNPDVQGQVSDMTEAGMGIIGIEADVDDVRTLVILGDPFGEIESLEFEAICRWSRKPDPYGPVLTGFQITLISSYNLTRLHKLIRLVDLQSI